MNRFNVVLLDLDGTLTDPRQGILESMRFALRGMGWEAVPGLEELEWCIGPPIRENFAKLLNTDQPAEIERAVSIYRERFGTVGLIENRVYEGIPAALRSIQGAGYRLMLATSKPIEYASRILERFEIDAYFSKLYGSEMNGVRGAKSDLLAYLLAEEHLDPAACLMVGDREHDIRGASANGISGWGVLWGYGSEEELVAAGAEELCRTPSKLADRLTGAA